MLGIKKKLINIEKLKEQTYLEVKRFNKKLLEKLEEKGMDKNSFPFVIRMQR